MDNNKCELPLEKTLELIASVALTSNSFPKAENYYEKYCEITKFLRANVYKNINAKLAALSEVSGLYTDHGSEHFDWVVKYAGALLGVGTQYEAEAKAELIKQGKWVLNAYELYLLLLSIRFHDVGNIFGRENHEQNIRKVIFEHKVVHLLTDGVESRKVCKLGGAHGGKAPNGSKDTIGCLEDDGTGDGDGLVHAIGFKKIAAITRVADEICENRLRDGELIESQIPPHNLIFHKYAYSIIHNYLKDRVLYIKFEVDVGDLLRVYQVYEKDKEKSENILVNEYLPVVIQKRLRKAELERRYCNRFLPEVVQIKEINVHIEVVQKDKDDHANHNVIEELRFVMKERDYPYDDDNILGDNATSFLDYERLKASKEYAV
jgi:hypothetical protein